MQLAVDIIKASLVEETGASCNICHIAKALISDP